MAKKMQKSQVLRHVVQFILFLLLPGLYAMTFSELKIVYQMITNGDFNFLQAVPSLIEFIAVMLLTIVMGRWFCGWLCAFGAHNDLIYFISKKIFKGKFKVNEKVDSYFDRASGTIIKNIISNQSALVNTVSGATYSSKGIIEAVKGALSQAK